jgi:uncharacterized protein (DUF2236 family)
MTETLVLGRLDPAVETGFHRGSMIRRVLAEPAVGLLIPRALVMEVAHPKVGAGVQDHSAFRRVPLRRLWATMDAAIRLVFGDPAVAAAAAQQIYSFHDHINGTVTETREGYTAHDASLLLWVWATLVDAAETGYGRWVRPLTTAEVDALYADLRSFARFFGIADSLLPADREAFAAYYDSVVSGSALGSTETGRALVRDVLWVPSPMVPDVLLRPARVITIALLDDRLRHRLNLKLEPRDQRLFAMLDRWIPRLNKALPRWVLRRLPYAYLKARRPPKAQAATVSPPTAATTEARRPPKAQAGTVSPPTGANTSPL